jgi:hypothetical protein
MQHVFQEGDVTGMMPDIILPVRMEIDDVASRGFQYKESPGNRGLGAFVRKRLQCAKG